MFQLYALHEDPLPELLLLENILPCGDFFLHSAIIFGYVAPTNAVHLYSRTARLPGVGAQGGDPHAARKAGTKYLIVGRSIINSSDPAKVAKTILARRG